VLDVLFALPVGMPFHLPLSLRGRSQTCIAGESASGTTASV
jgi:hypothetical protein